MLKGVSKKQLADDFGVKPPSIQGWVKYGRIDKAKLIELIQYFSPEVSLSHWGLSQWTADPDLLRDNVDPEQFRPGEKNAPSKDREPDFSSDQPNVVNVDGLPEALAQKISSYRPVVHIPRYDVAGSMGPGTEPPEMNMVVEHMGLDANWVRNNLTYTALDNLKLISGRGDSMSPTIRSGDAVIVDSGVTCVESDAIYFIEMRGQLQIKRIQRSLDGLRIISDNGQYPPIDVPENREADIRVLAQIIYWWTGRSF
ncbi:S24 family peptidase [Pseudomonas ovata]|uniref:S24 family peptidase n=1 Tax=Pseudomonas ovata TaxID=1839709 RepID=UPI000D68AF64|nr:S24 family peptidase [Pseudomonas ovata]